MLLSTAAKTVMVLAILIGTVSCSQQAKVSVPAPVAPSASTAAQKDAVVQIVVSGRVRANGQPTTFTQSGTGFVIEPGDLVVTASHVVTYREPSQPGERSTDTSFVFSDGITARYATDISVKLKSGREVRATPVTKLGPLQAALLRDYCVLRLDQKVEGPRLQFGTWDSLNDGDDLTTWGFPLGLPGPVEIKASVSLKMVQQAQSETGTPPENFRILIFQGPNNKGMSGGPVIQNRTGLVVGIVSSRLIGISQELDRVRQQVVATRNSGGVFIQGANPNASLLEIINVLDNFLMSGMGSAASTDPISEDLRRK